MPSKTLKQHKAMGAAAKGKSSLGIPAKVGESLKADKGKKFTKGKTEAMTALFDRDIYFGYVRDVLFEGALSQIQVDGQL